MYSHYINKYIALLLVLEVVVIIDLHLDLDVMFITPYYYRLIQIYILYSQSLILGLSDLVLSERRSEQ